MRIAVDIDDVLTASVPRLIESSNNAWGHKLTLDDYSEDWVRMWGVTPEEADRRSKYWHDSEFYHAAIPDPEALRVLGAMSNEHQLFVVTSRRLWVKDRTEDWIQQHYPGVFEGVHFAGMWEDPTIDRVAATKATTVSTLAADYLIDDQPKHCIGALAVGVRAILFGDYSWNSSDLHPDIERCLDWVMVEDYLDRYR